MVRALSHAKSRVKDPDQARQLEHDIVEAADYLEHAARQARAALLLVGAPFSSKGWSQATIT